MFTNSFRIMHTNHVMAPVRRMYRGFRSMCLYKNFQTLKEEIMFNIPTINLIETGKNIEKLRKSAGYSVRELQIIFGFATPQAIYKWQHGAALPTVDNLVLLSAIFKVSINEILVIDSGADVALEVSA